MSKYDVLHLSYDKLCIFELMSNTAVFGEPGSPYAKDLTIFFTKILDTAFLSSFN